MNNKVIFAAAGNGKTYNICRGAIKLASKSKDNNILLISYTNEGVKSIETEYCKQNMGVIDCNVTIKTWYSFLLSELIKPYQCLLQLKCKQYKDEYDFPIPENYINSIAFYQDGKKPQWYNKGHIQFFLNSATDIRKDDVSQLAYMCIEHSKMKSIKRLESIYSHIFIDELQDYAGWDLEIFNVLMESTIEMQFVGDYKQATYRTNNSSKNSKYRDENIKNYFAEKEKQSLCQISFDQTTRRFNKFICEFINSIYNEQQNPVVPYIEDLHSDINDIGVYILDKVYLEDYCKYYRPAILRYNVESKINLENFYNVFSYGTSKGTTFDRVIIIPVGTVMPFILNGKEITSKQTRAKFYVACTRAKYSTIFCIENACANANFIPTTILIGEKAIPCFKYKKQ